MPSQPLKLAIQANGFVAEIIRTSRRKTASIKIIEGQVSVIVPEALADEKIEALLAKKNRWIKEKLALQEQVAAIKPKEFVSGESFSYLGRNYRLKVIEGQYPSLKLHQPTNGVFPPFLLREPLLLARREPLLLIPQAN